MDFWQIVVVSLAAVAIFAVLVYADIDSGSRWESVVVRARRVKREPMGVVHFVFRVLNKQVTEISIRRVSIVSPRDCVIRSSNMLASQVNWSDSARVNGHVDPFSIKEFPMMCRISRWTWRIQLEVLVDGDTSGFPAEKRVSVWLLGRAPRA